MRGVILIMEDKIIQAQTLNKQCQTLLRINIHSCLSIVSPSHGGWRLFMHMLCVYLLMPAPRLAQRAARSESSK